MRTTHEPKQISGANGTTFFVRPLSSTWLKTKRRPVKLFSRDTSWRLGHFRLTCHAMPDSVRPATAARIKSCPALPCGPSCFDDAALCEMFDRPARFLEQAGTV